jgi:broad specificity phosphatase PhoE
VNVPIRKSAFVCILAVLCAVSAWAAPAEIIFVRHAEKPADGPTLNPRGYERANALVHLFEADARVLTFGKPVAIFSARPEKAGGSVRSIETMVPTGKALGITVDTRFTKDDISTLVQAVLTNSAFEGRTVLVCWEHKKIPDIVRAFGWTTAPSRWDDATFDRLWILDFDSGKPVRFRDLPQKLLAGDSSS